MLHLANAGSRAAGIPRPILTPQGHLLLAPAADAPALPAELERRLVEVFERGSGHGLLQLGASVRD